MADQRVEARQLEEAMRTRNVMMIGLAMVGLAACDRGQDANKLSSDTALSRDLNLANQAQPFQGLDSMSALETGPAQLEPTPLAAAPAPRSAASSATPTRRTASPARRSSRTYPSSTRRRSTSSGRTTTASAGDVDVGTRSEGRVVVKKNTKRDAAIGAAAGAVIGAATSRNKVKGAVIGGVAGGVLGAIIGNNVDVQKKRVP
jgi:hypothetical protein